MSPLLSQDDIRALTGYRRPHRQRAALASMGVRHYTRPDGRPVVVAADLSQHIRPALPATEPNWAALEAPHDPHPHPR